MNNVRYRQRRERYSRFQWACRRLSGHALKWSVLSYAFISVYGALYGPEPVLVHRLGTTLAVLCAGGFAVFFGLSVAGKLAASITAWRYRRGRAEYG